MTRRRASRFLASVAGTMTACADTTRTILTAYALAYLAERIAP